MDLYDVQLIGSPCGLHGPYTFYKAFKYSKNNIKRIITLNEFFFVKMWRDSDLLNIGELQLLWFDKNSEQILTSLRLYFLPENTPEGRMDHGEDEVLAISEKVIIRLEDLITWITVEAEWNWGRLAICEADLTQQQQQQAIISSNVDPENYTSPPRKVTGSTFSLSENILDFSDVEQEKQHLEPLMENDDKKPPHVIILSYPKYCRYRAMMKRLEGVENVYLKYRIVNSLGGFYVKYPNTRVLFCRDNFDYPELEGHELLCNHLAPKLKGRPRGKRKKRSVSPGSESNESESSISNHYTRSSEKINGLWRSDSPMTVATRRSTRCHNDNNENKEFMKGLTIFMKSKQIPLGRVPSLGYKELNLREFYIKVQKLGGYDCVTTNRLWKTIFDDMTGHLNSTSAATIIRRHYERFLLAFERHEKGEEYKPLPICERRRLKRKRSSVCLSDAESSNDTSLTSSSTSRTDGTPPIIDQKESTSPGKTSSALRSVRVKTERQKEKQNSISDQIQTTTAIVSLPPLSPSSPSLPILHHHHHHHDHDHDHRHDSISPSSIDLENDTIRQTCVKIEPVDSSSCELVMNETLEEKVTVEVNVKVKVETATRLDKQQQDNNDDNEMDIHHNKHEIKTEIIKDEENAVSPPPPPPQSMMMGGDIINMNPSTPEGTKTDLSNKTNEPLTTAVAPVTIRSDNVLSPVEGKENVPVMKTACGSANIIVAPELGKFPYKVKTPDIITIDNDNDIYKNSFMDDVKKINKLDILKEGGLEVTPVAHTAVTNKDIRPSVIQPTSHLKVYSRPEFLNSSNNNNNALINNNNNNNHNKAQIVQMKPTCCRSSNKSNRDHFHEGSSASSNIEQLPLEPPPKAVHQSKSIYSYSEKIIYGNPKDILQQPFMNSETPKFMGPSYKNTGGGGGHPMDLSITSPQKPISALLEFTRLPLNNSNNINNVNAHSSNSIYNRNSVNRNLYKTAMSSSTSASSTSATAQLPPIMIDGKRKLSANLEITLVNPHKDNNFLSKSSSSSSTTSRSTTTATAHANYVPKSSSPKRNSYKPYHISRTNGEENNKHYNKYNIPALIHNNNNNHSKPNVEITVHPTKINHSSSTKTDGVRASMHQKPPTMTPPQQSQSTLLSAHLQQQQQLASVQQQLSAPPHLSGLDSINPYLMDSLYYQAALQNVYSNFTNMPPTPIPLPVLTPEQLKYFYAELMSHRHNLPYSLPTNINKKQ